jgi:type II secretory pathway component PulM
MTAWFDKLNLRPQERRLVMLAGVVLFVVLNVFFVWPIFGRLQVVRTQLQTELDTAAKYEQEISKTPVYEAKLQQLQEGGSTVDISDQPLALLETVRQEAAAANLFVQRITPGGDVPMQNNPFFVEQRVRVDFVGGEPELVEFLKKLGSGTSLMRVRDMDLKPDPTQQKLIGSLTVIGSYQKKTGGKPGLKGGASESRAISGIH